MGPEEEEEETDQVLDELLEDLYEAGDDPEARTTLLMQYDHAEMNIMFSALADRYLTAQLRVAVASKACDLLCTATDSNASDDELREDAGEE